MDEDAPLTNGGWQIATRFATAAAADATTNFYAVYEGEAFGHPERGIIAIIARGHPAQRAGMKGAQETAQLVVHSFAEGYFGAPRTLAPKRAAHLALTSINAWLHPQIKPGIERMLAPVSLTAMLFQGAAVGVVQIGATRAFRCRNQEIAPLMADDYHGPEEDREPARAIGRDPEFFIDYEEIDAEPQDRFLLASGFGTAAEVTAGFRLQLPENRDVSAILLEVQTTPARASQNAELAHLPVRRPPREGDVWDGFLIGKTIYHGRYTILKRARDLIEDRDVVLKIPLAAMLQDEIFTAGFMREAWIGTTVRGPYVARYIELPPDRRSSLYLVLPYYPGETLEQRLHRAPPISLPDGAGIAIRLCEAVQDLAAIGIVHRDLKPENVMLLEKNALKLLDLGLAYLPGIDMRDAVKPGGTLRYMAPELMKGAQANARTEVYALGITIYRMFAGGAFPFGQRETLPLARLRPDLPAWLGETLRRAIAPDPTERFADAGELAKALHEGLVSGPDGQGRQRGLSMADRLRVWQLLTLVFALGFFFLLLRTLH